MRVESAATAEKRRGAGETAGGLPGGGQWGVQLGPNAIGGHHFVVGLHGGGTDSANYPCLPVAQDPISGGEGHQLGPTLSGGHDGGVGQVALPSGSP